MRLCHFNDDKQHLTQFVYPDIGKTLSPVSSSVLMVSGKYYMKFLPMVMSVVQINF